MVIVADLQATGVVPDHSTVRALQRIAWSSCAAGLQLVHAPYDQIHQAVDQLHGCVIGGEGDRLVPDADDVAVCREALEVLSVCLALSPEAVDVLYKERVWQTFIIDVLLVCRNRLLTVESSRCTRLFMSADFSGVIVRCFCSPKSSLDWTWIFTGLMPFLLPTRPTSLLH